MGSRAIFKVLFLNQGKVYEIYARSVAQGALMGFVEVEELLFGERSQVVIDPSEERLKAEFQGVRRTYLPMHSVLRIDEVEEQGTARILPAGQESAAAPVVPLSFPGGGGRKP